MNKNEMKMIEEMAKAMCERITKCKECLFNEYQYCIYHQGATALYNAGYRKVADDEIVIKKSEYEELRLAKYKAMEEAIEYEKTAYQQFEQAKQEEAREILTTIYNNLKYATFKQTGALSSIKTLANELGIDLGE